MSNEQSKFNDNLLLAQLLAKEFSLNSDASQNDVDHLLENNAQAQHISQKLSATLKPLTALNDIQVPTGLGARTMGRIHHYQSAQTMVKASQAIASQSMYQNKGGFRISGYLLDGLVAAVAIMMLFGLLNPSMKHAREVSKEALCRSNLIHVGNAFGTFAGDHDGLLPHDMKQNGASWWYVGSAQKDRTSNTSSVMNLVKEADLSMDCLQCDANKNGKKITKALTPEQIACAKDIYCRNELGYSVRVMPNNIRKLNQFSNQILMADNSPLFAKLCACKGCDNVPTGVMKITPRQMFLNSSNHAGRGQNLLFSDGHVKFSSSRKVGVKRDDIYAIGYQVNYQGNERPKTITEIFIAP
jgi:hypothetical protein